MKFASLFAASALIAAGTIACSQASNPASPSSTTGASLTSAVEGGALTGAPQGAAAPSEAFLAAARQATAKYHDVNKAIEDGYMAPEADQCFEIPGIGAMGIHSVNMNLAMDQVVDPTKPEILLYAPKNGGGFKLVGIEWFVPVDGPNTQVPRPSVLGHSFDGPMAGHEPGQPWHYDLHVWAWEPNPNGVFAQFNPNVTCATK